ncbi:MAG: hypothetical protein JSR45_00465 [Proteobacteria bacterium]|nr:hypothetical protein [Pseudomonadota bacterium]
MKLALTASALAAALALSACAPLSRLTASHLGPCRYDTEALEFKIGDARTQARCLLRHVRRSGVLGPAWPLPPTLGRLVGTADTPSVGALRRYIASRPMAPDQAQAWATLAADLDKPISRGWNNRPDAPAARYFVIHDTSTPYLEAKPFPSDLDHDPQVNDLTQYFRGEPVAHVFVNRRGEIAVGHTFSTPWRATKRERFTDARNKGMFIHIEMGQPRRQSKPGTRDDTLAPRPGFGERQYESLALLYICASVQAGRWLTPGFHSAVDEGIAAKHDDPQHFDIGRLDRALARELKDIR